MPVAQQQKKQTFWGKWGPTIAAVGIPMAGIAGGVYFGRRAARAAEDFASRSRSYGGGGASAGGSRFWGNWEDFFNRSRQQAGGYRPPPPPPRTGVSQAHDVLGVKPGVTAPDLKKAWRDAAFQHHPDRGGSTQKMQDINDAYEALKGHYKYADLIEMASFLDRVWEG